MPMFPLGTVLLPHGVLPLQVFEPRYQTMMEDLDPADPHFGVVLIVRGSEVGGGDVRSDRGTRARVVHRRRREDGRWVVVAAGVGRLRVEKWLPDDPYPSAMVVGEQEAPWDPVDAESLREAERAVRRSLALAAEVGVAALPATMSLADDPAVATWQLAAAVPVGPADRHRLLVADSAADRLRLVKEMAVAAAELLAFRIGGG
jgi:Lon protease-like protein